MRWNTWSNYQTQASQKPMSWEMGQTLDRCGDSQRGIPSRRLPPRCGGLHQTQLRTWMTRLSNWLKQKSSTKAIFPKPWIRLPRWNVWKKNAFSQYRLGWHPILLRRARQIQTHQSRNHQQPSQPCISGSKPSRYFYLMVYLEGKIVVFLKLFKIKMIRRRLLTNEFKRLIHLNLHVVPEL